MANGQKNEIDLNLLKSILEEAGLSTADLLSKLAGGGVLSKCTACDTQCTTCNVKCSGGPDPSRSLDPYIIYPHERERLIQEILAELKR